MSRIIAYLPSEKLWPRNSSKIGVEFYILASYCKDTDAHWSWTTTTTATTWMFTNGWVMAISLQLGGNCSRGRKLQMVDQAGGGGIASRSSTSCHFLLSVLANFFPSVDTAVNGSDSNTDDRDNKDDEVRIVLRGWFLLWMTFVTAILDPWRWWSVGDARVETWGWKECSGRITTTTYPP